MMLKQDDPAKCTAAKLAKFGIADAVRMPKRDSIVLNPFSESPILRSDANIATSICAIDCSWERAEEVLRYRSVISRGIMRRLPALLAANPVNYSKLSKLTTAEALAAGLYVLGDVNASERVMNKFKWGHTFFELNIEPLKEYSLAENDNQIKAIEESYFQQLRHDL